MWKQSGKSNEEVVMASGLGAGATTERRRVVGEDRSFGLGSSVLALAS